MTNLPWGFHLSKAITNTYSEYFVVLFVLCENMHCGSIAFKRVHVLGKQDWVVRLYNSFEILTESQYVFIFNDMMEIVKWCINYNVTISYCWRHLPNLHVFTQEHNIFYMQTESRIYVVVILFLK